MPSRMKGDNALLQALPLGVVLLGFFGIPMLIVLVVSFCDYNNNEIVFRFTVENYLEILSSSLTYAVYLNSIKYTLIVLSISLGIGFFIAYYLAFFVRSTLTKIALLLLCTIPFWTSNIIRMISWIPILGREGLINSSLVYIGVIRKPLDFLLFTDVSVIVAYVHLFTLFMIVPIFNAMARIDPRLLEAARDSGAGEFRILRDIVIPLSKSGIMLGAIFIVTLVMGDFYVVRVMSGGQRSSVASVIYSEIASLQYPPAAANATVLVTFVGILVVLLLRVVDVRKELVEQDAK